MADATCDLCSGPVPCESDQCPVRFVRRGRIDAAQDEFEGVTTGRSVGPRDLRGWRLVAWCAGYGSIAERE